MSVFHLEHVLDKRICGQTLAEVFLGTLESLGLDLALSVVNDEVIEQSDAFSLLVDLVDAHCVANHFN